MEIYIGAFLGSVLAILAGILYDKHMQQQAFTDNNVNTTLENDDSV